MGSTTEFAEILKKKLSPQREKPSNPPRLRRVTIPHSPFIDLGTFEWKPKTSQKVYAVKTQKPKAETQNHEKQAKPIPEKSYSIGELGLEHSTDFMALVAHGAELEEAGLRLSSLKRQYRILAKKYHPDHCSSPDAAEVFQTCREAYDNLLKAISAKQNR